MPNRLYFETTDGRVVGAQAIADCIFLVAGETVDVSQVEIIRKCAINLCNGIKQEITEEYARYLMESRNN